MSPLAAPAPATYPSPDASHLEPPRAAPPLATALAALDTTIHFLSSVPDHTFSRASAVLPGGTIGKHARHLLDHFQALLPAVADPASPIDYDHRARNVPIETDRLMAISAAANLRESLLAVPAERLRNHVTIRVMLGASGASQDFPSTLARELVFVAHHAIHHHAMIKAIAAEHGVACEPRLGLAPSTIVHENGPRAAPAPAAR